MIDSGEAPRAAVDGKNALAVAWAAGALRTLSVGVFGCGEPRAHMREVKALADWTGGIAHVTRGQMAEATQCFDRAAEIFRSLGQANLAAQTQVPKIMALSMLGQYDDAVECAEQAQREFVAQGDVLAARDSRAAAVSFARVGDHDHSVMADINMANALASMGDFDEAASSRCRCRIAETDTGRHPLPLITAPS